MSKIVEREPYVPSITANLVYDVLFQIKMEACTTLKTLYHTYNKELVIKVFSKHLETMYIYTLKPFTHDKLKIIFQYLDNEFDFNELVERIKDLQYEYKYGLDNLEVKGFI